MNYKIIDHATAAIVGGMTAVAVAGLTPASWPMFWGMVAGMFAGMLIDMVLALLLMPFLGAFEVMIPLHLVGMFAGMLGGMATAWPNTPWHCLAGGGALTGLAIAYLIGRLNIKLTRAGHVVR
jgi:hypothetical protein